jgi:glycosyltransferase EpsF
MKVLQVTGTMNRGGAEVMLMDILRNKPDDVHFDFLTILVI